MKLSHIFGDTRLLTTIHPKKEEVDIRSAIAKAITDFRFDSRKMPDDFIPSFPMFNEHEDMQLYAVLREIALVTPDDIIRKESGGDVYLRMPMKTTLCRVFMRNILIQKKFNRALEVITNSDSAGNPHMAKVFGDFVTAVKAWEELTSAPEQHVVAGLPNFTKYSVKEALNFSDAIWSAISKFRLNVTCTFEKREEIDNRRLSNFIEPFYHPDYTIPTEVKYKWIVQNTPKYPDPSDTYNIDEIYRNNCDEWGQHLKLYETVMDSIRYSSSTDVAKERFLAAITTNGSVKECNVGHMAYVNQWTDSTEVLDMIMKSVFNEYIEPTFKQVSMLSGMELVDSALKTRWSGDRNTLAQVIINGLSEEENNELNSRVDVLDRIRACQSAHDFELNNTSARVIASLLRIKTPSDMYKNILYFVRKEIIALRLGDDEQLINLFKFSNLPAPANTAELALGIADTLVDEELIGSSYKILGKLLSHFGKDALTLVKFMIKLSMERDPTGGLKNELAREIERASTNQNNREVSGIIGDLIIKPLVKNSNATDEDITLVATLFPHTVVNCVTSDVWTHDDWKEFFNGRYLKIFKQVIPQFTNFANVCRDINNNDIHVVSKAHGAMYDLIIEKIFTSQNGKDPLMFHGRPGERFGRSMNKIMQSNFISEASKTIIRESMMDQADTFFEVICHYTSSGNVSKAVGIIDSLADNGLLTTELLVGLFAQCDTLSLFERLESVMTKVDMEIDEDTFNQILVGYVVNPLK